MIWLGLALLFAVCVLALAVPLLREPRPVDKADPLAPYREALAALDGEEKEGLRAPADIAEDRAELERRMLNAARKADRAHAPMPAHWIRPLLTALIGLVGLGAVALYQTLGSPGQPGQPFAQKPDEQSAKRAELAALAETLRHNVLANEDAPAEAWAALGLAYMQLGRFPAAATVLSEAVRKQPDAVAYRLALAESLIFAGQGQVSDEAFAALQAVLALDETNQAARFYLVRAMNERQRFGEAYALALPLSDELERQDPKRFQVLSELWKAAIALGRPVPSRVLPPPAMREALKERGIDLPLPEGEADGEETEE